MRKTVRFGETLPPCLLRAPIKNQMPAINKTTMRNMYGKTFMVLLLYSFFFEITVDVTASMAHELAV